MKNTKHRDTSLCNTGGNPYNMHRNLVTPSSKAYERGASPWEKRKGRAIKIKGTSADPVVPPSSSPVPAHTASPTKSGTTTMDRELPKVEEELDDDHGFDLTK